MIAELARRLTPDARITVMTGAGVSAASGVPTFRGADGLWKNFRAEQLATPDAFARDPRRVWEWYDWRRQTIAACAPNAAHDVLASWSRRFSSFTLITQNVDGLHETAGTANVLRLHGSIWEVMCVRRLGRRSLGEGGRSPGGGGCTSSPRRWRDDTVPFPEIPPKCPHCGGLIRPGVVWFGEALDPAVVEQAARASSACDVFITIGTSSIVYPAAGLVDQARRGGAFTVEINPEATPASSIVDLVLRGPAETVLPQVASLVL